jgi:hypothetical protein
MEISATKAKPLSTEQAMLKLQAFIEREKSKNEEIEEAMNGGSTDFHLRRIEDDVVHRLELLANSMQSIVSGEDVITVE